MESTIERELPDNQAGFRKARGTRDHIANMRWIMERQLEYGKEVHICFIDYIRTFDCINHELFWKILLEMGIPQLCPPVMKMVTGSINWVQGNRILSSFNHFAYGKLHTG